MATDTRKLQRVGSGTFMVSIPKDWAVEHDLDASADVHLYCHGDGSMVVRSSAKDADAFESTTLHVGCEDSKAVARALRAAHAVGYDTVTIRPHGSFTDGHYRAARRAKRGLVGTEVVVERGDEITMRSLLDTGDVSVRQSVVQLQFVVLSICRRATAAIVEDAGVDLDRLDERAVQAERLAATITRHFSRSQASLEEVDRLETDRPRLFDYHATARELTRVAEEAVSIGRAGERIAEPMPDDHAEDVRAVADASIRVVEDATTAVLEVPPIEDVSDIRNRSDGVVADVDALDSVLFEGPSTTYEGSTGEVRALTRALDGIARIATVGGSIAEVALRAATRTDGK